MPRKSAKEKKMTINKIGKTILLALSLTAIIVAMSCSGADATKPEDMKIDLGQELGSGKYTTPELATTNNADNTAKYVLVTGGTSSTSHFFSSLLTSISGYSHSGAGIMVTDILKVIRADVNATPENEDITGIATAVKNDVGGVYRVDLATTDTNINIVQIEFSYKLKVAPSTTAPKITHTKMGINNADTNIRWIDLYTEIADSSESSLFGKTYVIGTADNINIDPTTYTSGLITNNILTNLNMANGAIYKLWIY